MARLTRITLYPIKSLDGLTVDSARLLPSGALEYDRRWALLDESGALLNAKRSTAIHQLAARFELAEHSVALADRRVAQWHTFDLLDDPAPLVEFVGQVLGQRVQLCAHHEHGWPDDLDALGPTVVSTATLETVATWYSGLTLDNVRGRFRANLEIGNVAPFWEDRLVGPVGSEVAFQIGSVTLSGVNPCQRCAVPTRDPATGEVLPGFAKRFAAEREAALPREAVRARFDHYYRLSVNTRLPRNRLGGTIHVGDELQLC